MAFKRSGVQFSSAPPEDKRLSRRTAFFISRCGMHGQLPEHFQFEMLCISNHTACRFAAPLFFRSLRAGRRCAAPPRVSPFSKLKRFKCRRNIRTPKRGRLPKGNAPVSLQAAPTQCRARAFQFKTRCILNHTPVVSKKSSIWAANPAARQSCDRRAAACTHQ